MMIGTETDKMNKEEVRARLRAAIYTAIAELGEKEARSITMECINKADDDHWAGQR